MNNKLVFRLSVALCLVFALLASTSSAQITFSRDWLAGSGKRSPKVTFSRDWLAGSGKRSSLEVASDNADFEARRAVEYLVEYLTSQMAPAPAKVSFHRFLEEQHQKA